MTIHTRTLYLVIMAIIVYVIGMHDTYTKDTNELAIKIDRLYTEKSQLEDRLAEYTVTEEYLQNLGATPDQARKIIKASEVHNVSPKSLDD